MSELAHARPRAAAPTRRGLAAVATPARIVYCGTAAWAAAFAALAILRHLAFRSGRFDLGNMVQAVWSTAHGRFLETSAAGGQFTRLGAHFDPILALFAPLWLVWPSPALLLVVQAVAVAAGTLPVFWLGRKHLPSPAIAAWLAFAYLLYAPVQWLTVDEFHPVALGVPLLLFALWCLDEDRIGAFAICAVLACLTGEAMPALVAWLGLWYAVRRRRRRAGVVIAAAGLAASALALEVVVPAFAPGTSLFADRYGSFGGSPTGVASAILHRPLDVLGTLASGHHLAYVLLLVVPWAGLFVLEPLLACGAAPMLLLNLLSQAPEQSAIGFHYTAGIVPFLVGASVLGAARLPEAKAQRVTLVVLALMTLGLVLSPARFVGSWVADLRAPKRASALAALELIPRDAPVTASNHLGAYLSARRRILTFPVVRDARWAVLDTSDGFVVDEYAPRRYRVAVARLRRDPRWRLVFAENGILVLKRELGKTGA